MDKKFRILHLKDRIERLGFTGRRALQESEDRRMRDSGTRAEYDDHAGVPHFMMVRFRGDNS